MVSVQISWPAHEQAAGSASLSPRGPMGYFRALAPALATCPSCWGEHARHADRPEILVGVAMWLLAIPGNQIANQLDLSYGFYAAALAAIIGYGLVVTSGPARKHLWRQSRRGRRRIMVILLTGIVTGLLGSATAKILIWQEERASKKTKPEQAISNEGILMPASDA